MSTASDLKRGMVIQRDGHPCQVLSSEFHTGSGKMGGIQHVKLKNLRTGIVLDQRFRPDERVEQVETERKKFDHLYRDGEFYVFMNPDSYEQVSIHESELSGKEVFLTEGLEISALFCEGSLLAIDFPEFVDLRVVTAPPPLHEQDTSTYKSVTL
jgi:elongation factor P